MSLGIPYGVPDDLSTQVLPGVTEFTTTSAFFPGTLSVTLQGTTLGLDEYEELTPNTFRILSEIYEGDSLVVRYNLAVAQAWSEYPPP